jgi:hypothetical protein
MNRRALLLVLAGVVACVIGWRVLLRAGPSPRTGPEHTAVPPASSHSFPTTVRRSWRVMPAPELSAEPSADPEAPSGTTSFDALLEDLVERHPGTPKRAGVSERRPVLTTQRPEGWKWDALVEMVNQTRHRDVVFTRRTADDQTIAYLAEAWDRSDDETLIGWLRGERFTGPDGEKAAFLGFYDLAEPYGTILLRVDGHETVLRFGPPASGTVDAGTL